MVASAAVTRCGQPVAGPPGHRLDQPLAITEVVVDERAGDARGVGDLLEGDAGRVAPVEYRGGGVDQEGPPLLPGQPRPGAVGAGLLGHPGGPERPGVGGRDPFVAPLLATVGAVSPMSGKWQAT